MISGKRARLINYREALLKIANRVASSSASAILYIYSRYMNGYSALCVWNMGRLYHVMWYTYRRFYILLYTGELIKEMFKR